MPITRRLTRPLTRRLVGPLDGLRAGAPPVPVIPVANFSGTPLSGTTPLLVQFTDLSSGPPTSWLWDFGDGGNSTLQNPSHNYIAPGPWNVILTATNGLGSDGETKNGYIVTSAPAVAPVANFTGTPLSGAAPLNVTFTDSSSNSPTSWAWNFGDGGTSTQQNPSHNYTVNGTYNVTLTATNAAGSSAPFVRTGYVTVSAALEPPVAGKVLWLKKGDVIQASSAVSQWNDSSGNSNHLVQGTAARRPALQGDNTVLFDGVDDFLQATFSFTSTSWVACLRVKKLNWASLNTLIDGAAVGSIAFLDLTATPQMVFANDATIITSDMTIGAYKSVVLGKNSTTGLNEIRVSGGATASNTGTLTAPNGVTLGSGGSGSSRFCNSQIVEILVYNVALTTAEMNQTLAYLDSLTP